MVLGQQADAYCDQSMRHKLRVNADISQILLFFCD